MLQFKSILRAVACVMISTATIFPSQANPAVSTKDVDASGFSAVRASGQFDVDITTGGKYDVKVTAPEKLMPYIKAEVKNGSLYVGLEKNAPQVQNAELKCTVNMPELSYVNANGQSTINVSGNALAENFTVKANGQSNVNVKEAVNVKGLVVDVNGQSNVDMTQVRAADTEMTVNGQSRVKADALVVTKGNVYSYGQSVVILNECDASEFGADAEGQSSIRIHKMQCPSFSKNADTGSSIRVK